MLFREVLALHRAARGVESQSDILGDGFLARENPIYRRVKARALALGAVYRPATADYLLLPFNQLESILSSKVIPYVPHARLMEEVETHHPGVFGLDQMPMPESYHLHESAHVIAEDACRGIALESREDRILKMILCESFANTVDAMACGYADTPDHRLFLKLNCYMAPVAATLALMKRVRTALGEATVARLLLLSYVYANFLLEEVPEDLLLGVEKLNQKTKKDLRALSLVGQRLDPLFRVQTTANFLLMAGLRGDVYDLLSFDFRPRLERADFARAFGAMVEVLTKESDT